ncbi:conjugal transfer protein [Nocardioides sp.]|uniref:conjugal transfer protein n=1 Tax=Nocardioides sp. TaxID=35761 RepID=UPI002734A593|nr:conjugal transfer protein [Nocardioides sp.]MDP3893617.1 conjugal transfer protein [Nocardioides sp.]
MKQLLTRRRGRDDEVAPETTATSADTTEDAADGPLRWTGPAARLTTTVSVLLKSALLACPVALAAVVGWLWWASMQPAPVTPVAGPEAGAVSERATAAAFAEDFVATWLTTPRGEEKALEPFLASSGGVRLPETPWVVSDLSTAAVEEADGTWAVTVAATVSTSRRDQGVRRWFQVPVVVDGGVIAQALPAPVAGPERAAPPRSSYRHRVGLTSPVATAAGDFLAGLMVTGDVTRLISPGAEIRSIVPAPYTGVKVEDVIAEDRTLVEEPTPPTGAQVQVLVTSTATTEDGREISTQHHLTLTAREGRWEVTSIDLAPPRPAAPEAAPPPPPGDTDPNSTN